VKVPEVVRRDPTAVPADTRAAAQRRWLRTNGRPEGFGAEESVRRIAERGGVTPDEAHALARAVFAMLREALPEREFDDVLAQLPRDYAALTARP
jgi:uncharacterized protein (DUF2267 family)